MEREEYEVMAQVEGRHWWYVGMRQLAAAWLDPVLAGAGRPRILDAGCGTGGNALFLQRYGLVIGLDISNHATSVAAERLPGQIQQASVSALPYAAASFDLVTSFEVLYHRGVPDELVALREIWRVLRPGGWLLLRLPALELLRRKHDLAVHTRRRYTRGEVRQLVQEAGFRVARSSYVNSLLFPLPLAQALLERAVPRLRRQSSDVALPDPLVNSVLQLPFRAEAAALRSGYSFPVGLSVLCLAQKEDL